ncbi:MULTISPECIES: hypothetical protein [Bacillus]|uniref:Uncharacterized protein n=3 Tax=Bacillus thuringiensis TaxID=1428 RepID=A0AAP4V4R4_BACTU|nr:MULTISPECIES: hypothetical protein [Bacillus]AEA16240.1 hypothetical protein CT43_CH2561 [Bacillus thuringiensis serovar chinensis CT-43]AFV18369.1 hypothetical protein BTB_c26850 [Bacillus thuringiensis Bt407]AGG01316.1 hypothetical protein H175_ch2603 [Bacillus thuringiensis serovar thuringiensis str. IS5056]ANC08048.1 hypothetical protein WR47_13405 [Bacillus cereus]ANC13870.1 hypothetical protein WR51_13410 [Bacillus cereus]
MAYESTKELILQIINENRDLLHPDSQKHLNMKFLLSDERLQHLSSDTMLKVVDQLVESGEIRCVVKRNPEDPTEIINFAVKEIY